MKFQCLLSFSLLALTLIGCKQRPFNDSQSTSVMASAGLIENGNYVSTDHKMTGNILISQSTSDSAVIAIHLTETQGALNSAILDASKAKFYDNGATLLYKEGSCQIEFRNANQSDLEVTQTGDCWSAMRVNISGKYSSDNGKNNFLACSSATDGQLVLNLSYQDFIRNKALKITGTATYRDMKMSVDETILWVENKSLNSGESEYSFVTDGAAAEASSITIVENGSTIRLNYSTAKITYKDNDTIKVVLSGIASDTGKERPLTFTNCSDISQSSRRVLPLRPKN